MRILEACPILFYDIHEVRCLETWLKTLTFLASHRDRRRGRGANRQVLHSRDMLNCGPFVEALEVKTLLSATPELVADILARYRKMR